MDEFLDPKPAKRYGSALKSLMNLLGINFLPPVLGLSIISFAALFIFIWFFCRIEPRQGQMAVLIKKTGRNLASGEMLALDLRQKGIQPEVLPEGRYFRNPYTWGWEIQSITDIPAGKLGIRTRLYGETLSPDKIFAEENTKGILADVLRPGKYRINPYAYHIELFDAIQIRPGHAGVVTSLVGKDVLTADLSSEERNTFLVGEELKGVIPETLDPGTYYLNPYMVNVIEVNLQSQRFEMSGEDVITFLTLDGFTVTVEGTIEYGLDREKSALLSHRVGDMEDIMKKVILPRARGFSRIEGSKHPAIDFIVGETRQKFQSDLELHLREKCSDWGVDIRSILVRKIIVPDQIASISRDREIAVQDANKYIQQIEQAKSKAELVKQEMLAQQNKEKVEAETVRIRSVINAQQGQSVYIVSAEKELEVAKLEKDAAVFQSESIRLNAEGQRDAIKAKNEAEASVLADQVRAFGTGMNLARYALYQKVAPKIDSILTDDEEESFGSIFESFLPGSKGVTP